MVPYKIEPRAWMAEVFEIEANFADLDARLMAKEGQFWDDLRSPASGDQPDRNRVSAISEPERWLADFPKRGRDLRVVPIPARMG